MNNKVSTLTKLFTELLNDLKLDLPITNYLTNFEKSTLDIVKEYQNDANLQELPLKIYQEPQKKIIGYMGVIGAFAYEASTQLFPLAEYKNYPTFKDVFEAIKNDEITYGVLPIENSSTGSINDNYDLIREYGFYIVSDLNLKVSQNLLGLKGATLKDIKKVYSHPQAIFQTKSFLESHNIKYEFYSNTATSAKYIKDLKDPSCGSISSKSCAKLYDLAIIVPDINEASTNTTRFVVVSKHLEIRPEAKQISIIFNLKHEAGTLFQILKNIKDYNLNMTRIESRPIKSRPFEYYFYLDFLGHIKDPNVILALTKIKQDSLNLRIIGNY